MKLTFCGQPLSYEAATSHFAYIGATGSGKTVMIRLLMQSVFGLSSQYNIPTRALIYDSKRDMLPVLYGIFEALGRTDAEDKIKLINPFDVRGVAWNMAEDIKEPAHAQELATILIPDEPNAKEPFFPNAARLILESVILSFITENPGQWTFRDVCLAVETEETITKILSRSDLTSWVINALFGEEKTTANIISTIAAYMRGYRIVAALWDRAKESISIHEWINSKEKILILGNSPTSRTAVDAINQVLFKRISQVILEEQPEIDVKNDLRRVWIFLDEFVRAGRFNGAVEIATEGRSKGVAFVIGFQDINGLRAVYGKEISEEILGQCSTIALLRMQSPETAEWASTLIGDYRGIDEIINSSSAQTYGKEASNTFTTNYQYQPAERRSLLPSFFRTLEPVTREKNRGVRGVFYSPFPPFEKVVDYRLEYDWLFTKGNLWDKAENVDGFKRCGAKDQYLERWNERRRDFERLKIRHIEKVNDQEEREKNKNIEERDLMKRALDLKERSLTESLERDGFRKI